jgi:putative membrane protein
MVKEGNMKKILLSFFSLMLICEVCRPTVVQGILSPSETDFVRAAAEDSLFQVKLGNLAEVKAADIAVKYFGENMADIYSKANEQLRALAKENDVELPQQIAIGPQRVYDELSTLKSDEFDEQYMNLMVEALTDAVAAFEIEQDLATDPVLKNWISDTLPVLRSQLQKAKGIADVVSGGKVE